LRVGNVERSEFRAKEAARKKRFQLFRLAVPFQPLAHADERRHDGIHWPEHASEPRSEMRRSHRLRWYVTSMPMVLVVRVENAAKIRQRQRANQRAAIENLGNVLEPLADLDVVHHRIN
jgi:hypothetical protein